mgnify:CR=1 FL=1
MGWTRTVTAATTIRTPTATRHMSPVAAMVLMKNLNDWSPVFCATFLPMGLRLNSMPGSNAVAELAVRPGAPGLSARRWRRVARCWAESGIADTIAARGLYAPQEKHTIGS